MRIFFVNAFMVKKYAKICAKWQNMRKNMRKYAEMCTKMEKCKICTKYAEICAVHIPPLPKSLAVDTEKPSHGVRAAGKKKAPTTAAMKASAGLIKKKTHKQTSS